MMATLPKSPHGTPCNSCGRCCLIEICPIGEKLFGTHQGPCPAIEPSENGRLECGVMRNPTRYAPARAAVRGDYALRQAALLLLGVGRGCDYQADGEPRHPTFIASWAAHVRANRWSIRRAAQAWGMPI